MKITKQKLNKIKLSVNINFPKTMEILNNIEGIKAEDFLSAILELQKAGALIYALRINVVEDYFLDDNGEYVNDLNDLQIY